MADSSNNPATQGADRSRSEGVSLPVLLAKAAALSASIDRQAAKLASELGHQLAGLHGMEPMPAPGAPLDLGGIDTGALVAQAQAQMVTVIDRLRGMADELSVVPMPPAAGAPVDPLGALLAGLAGHAQAQLGAQTEMTPVASPRPPVDIDLSAVLSAAKAAHGKAQLAVHDLLAGMGLDPADPLAGLAQRLPSAPADSAPALPPGGGDLLGSMQGDVARLQAVLVELSAKVIPPP